MNTATYALELVTPCFCGGARPETQAEIRAASIRGQLRWWFRTLGGFKSLEPLRVPEQEQRVFGSSGGQFAGRASPLTLRVQAQVPLRAYIAKDAAALNAPGGSDRGYLLFPLQYRRRAVFDVPQLPKFDLHLLWRGEPELWVDIQALAAVYGHLGSLGWRCRRAMGALAFQSAPPSLDAALARFGMSQQIILRQMPARGAADAVTLLAKWLRGWRSHGRSQDLRRTGARGPGFKWAQNDHAAGRNRGLQQTYRPALGLPMAQQYSSGGRPVNWHYGAGTAQDPPGRFASPVLLRPYRTAQNQWLALVIFVEPHRWPAGKKVFVDGQPRAVLLDLYEAMQRDVHLQPFFRTN